jgi:hypothetical protein
MAGSRTGFKTRRSGSPLVLLRASAGVVLATVLLGLVLVALYARSHGRLIRLVGPVHGIFGVAALLLLILALRGPLPGAQTGVSGFGPAAAVFLAFAVLAGLWVRSVGIRKLDPMLPIGIHATLAIFGAVLLAACASIAR